MTAGNRQPTRHEIEELLPWYAAETLSGREAERVEQALAGDRELARRYELVRQELAETVRLNETLGAPSARAVDKLFAAINAEEIARCRTPVVNSTLGDFRNDPNDFVLLRVEVPD